MNVRILGLLLLLFVGEKQLFAPPPNCALPKVVFSISGVPVLLQEGILAYTAGMAIDADGAPNAYHPEGLGLDLLHNAGGPGAWSSLVTDNLKSDGEPVVQQPGDPAPGFYVSMTSLEDEEIDDPRDPHRYVDSSRVPYIVVPPAALKFVSLGDFAMVTNRRNGKRAAAIVADIGPESRIGEASIALAEQLGINSDARHGGAMDGVSYIIFPHSGEERPQSVEVIQQKVEELRDASRGEQGSCVPDLDDQEGG